jgi:murein L,D-transpeptidase YafK
VVSCHGGGERRWVVALGRAPGPKRTEGDHRTPEGEYRVGGGARSSRFHRFLAFDYPSPADAAHALAEGRIDARTHDAIVRARAELRLPPQDTVLGGLLGFHGEGRRWQGDSEHLDWTDGCIAMTDERIDFLVERAAPGTPVVIYP